MPRCSSSGGSARRSAPRRRRRPRSRPRLRAPSQPPAAARRRGSRTAGWRTAGRRRPAPPCRTAPASARRCSTSLRKRWLNQTARAVPERSRSATSKTLKPGRRVRLSAAATTVPMAEHTRPGASSASGRGCAAIFVAQRKADSRSSTVCRPGRGEVGGAATAHALQRRERAREAGAAARLIARRRPGPARRGSRGSPPAARTDRRGRRRWGCPGSSSSG